MRTPRVLATAALFCLVPFLPAPPAASAGAEAKSAPSEFPSVAADPPGRLGGAFGLPIVFEANRGQTAKEVQFLARGRGYTLLVTQGELVFTLSSPSLASGLTRRGSVPRRAHQLLGDRPADGETRSVRLRFEGANPQPETLGTGLLPGRAHYLRGSSPDSWVRNVPTFEEVVVLELYPGVDLRLHTRTGELEYDLVLSPGADPERIELVIEGADNVNLLDDGGLAIGSGRGELLQRAPFVYEVVDGEHRPVEASYRRLPSGRFAFEVPDRDPAAQLVIDPVITYSTYFGGDHADALFPPQFDPQGNLYLHGFTGSVQLEGLPITAPRDRLHRSEWDAFLVQLSASGRTVLSWLYIGGKGTEIIGGFGFDFDGNLLLAGTTDAYDFPFRSYLREPLAGDQDVFLVKIDPRDGEVLFAESFGGISHEWLSGFGMDRFGTVYVAGGTLSADLPVRGGFQRQAGGDFDCFVAKFHPEDGQLLAATYFGGFSTEFCDAAAVTPSGEVYLTGEVIDGGLPLTPGVFQERYGGHTRNYIGDAFVAKLDRRLELVYSSYLGGPRDEYALGIAVDDGGNAYVTGISMGEGFPLVNPLRATRGLGDMAFVSKVSPSGSELLFSTYLGGSLGQYGRSVVYDPRWGVIVVGTTGSFDFPVRDPVQATIHFDPDNATLGGYPLGDGYVTVLSPDGTEIRFSTFLGSTESDSVTGVSVDQRGGLWITGGAGPEGFPVVNPLQASPATTSEGLIGDPFLTKIEPGNPRATPRYITSPAFPDYRFSARFLRADGSALGGAEAGPCPPETLCIAGAVPNRTEVMVRVAGPKPNGRAWPHVVKFSTAEVEVLVEQLSTGEKKIYRLAGASATSDRLPGLFDRRGFVPMAPSWSFGATAFGLRPKASLPAPGAVFTSPHFPDFRFRARISAGDQVQEVRKEAACIEETLCLSAAIPGRSEVFLRIVGPKPNGRLWPTIVKFTTSTLEVWIEQVSTGETTYYRIEGAAPGKDDLTGLFDRAGFAP